MADYRLEFTIDVDTDQKAVALRDGAKQYLLDHGAAVSDWSSGKQTQTYRVRGVDISTSEVVDQQVPAAAPEEAAATVTGANANVVIVDVEMGE